MILPSKLLDLMLFNTSTNTVMFVALVSDFKIGLRLAEKSLYESLLSIKPLMYDVSKKINKNPPVVFNGEFNRLKVY